MKKFIFQAYEPITNFLPIQISPKEKKNTPISSRVRVTYIIDKLVNNDY